MLATRNLREVVAAQRMKLALARDKPSHPRTHMSKYTLQRQRPVPLRGRGAGHADAMGAPRLVGTRRARNTAAASASAARAPSISNGAPTRACQTQVSSVGPQSEITTIEGLDPAGKHPLQKAWCELDVPQCGYCQAGQIMTAAALLKRNPHPNDAEIDRAMAGNLCRCATYFRIRAGIKRAAELASGRTPAEGGQQ